MTATKPKPSMREALAHLKRPASPSAPESTLGLVTRRHRKAKPKPLRRVDALMRIPLFAPFRGTALAVEPTKTTESFNLTGATRLFKRPGRSAVRSPRGVGAAIEGLGLTSLLSPKGRVTWASPGGRVDPELAAIVGWQVSVAEWVAADRRGQPMECDWCPSPSVTLLLGGVPACEQHAAA